MSHPAAGGSTAAVPVPPNDVPAPRLPSPRGALRRSLLVWGWGLVAMGDRRGWLLPPLEVAVLALLVGGGLPLAAGETVGWVFLAGAAALALWAAQAVLAYRRAARRRLPFGLTGADGGAVELLWLAPLAIAAATLFWTVAGRSSSADATLARYAADWSAGQAPDAAALFAGPVDAAALDATWQRQAPRLRNALVVAAATAGPASGIDPARPFDGIRWEADTSAGGRLVVHARIVRRQAVHDTFFGLVPTTVERLEPVADLGTVTLVATAAPGPLSGWPTVTTWQIASIDLLDERLPAPP